MTPRQDRFVWKHGDITYERRSRMEMHLEYIPLDEQEPWAGCPAAVIAEDYETGLDVAAECGEMVTVWFVYEEDGEVDGVEFCRRHGNLTLIQERQAQR